MKYSKLLIGTMAVLLAGGVAFGQADPPFVFTSDPSEGSIAVIDIANGDAFEIYSDEGAAFEDLVFGPDGLLYACDPTNGEIIRLDFGDGVSVEYVYTSSSGEDLSPQCGWFTSKGDLLFTDTSGGGLWICRDLAFGNPSGGQYEDPLCKAATPVESADIGLLEPVPASGYGFYGEGITQAADGDALAVENEDGASAILHFEMDRPSGTFLDQAPAALDLVDELGDPVALDASQGIARLSNGDIFVTGRFDIEVPDIEAIVEVPGVRRFTPIRDPETGEKYWLNTCNVTLSVCEGYGQPYFLEAAADDTIYVGSNDGCFPAELWTITVSDGEGSGCDDPQQVFPSEGTEWAPANIEGLAVTPTGTAPLDIAPGPPSDGSQDYFFNFSDHVLELTTPEECTVELVEARETPKQCLDEIIANRVDLDGENGFDFLDGVPVLYLGDKAYGQTYYIEGECGGLEDGTFRYAVSAYTEDLFNPRIIRCDFSAPEIEVLSETDVCFPDDTLCEVIDLASFFPGEGVLPDDGRISGSRSSTADFSQYFVVDSGPGGYSGEGEPGCACGFRPPVRNVDDPFADGKSIFREGRSVPFKLRITDGACDELDGCCQGDYIAPSGVLLSIARLYDENGERDFEEIVFECRGGGCDEIPYFEDPKKPKAGYHMNVRTDGWAPGTYIATATVTNKDNGPNDTEYVVPVLVTYFDIIP